MNNNTYSPTIEEKAQAYIEVFGEDPRNEGYIDNDGKLYPLSYTGDTSNMKLFYNKEELIQQREERSKKTGYVEHIPTDESGNIKGFGLGRTGTLSSLNEEKFNIPQEAINEIQKTTKTTSDELFFYLSEIGVNPTYRGEKIASNTYNNIIPKNKNIILRTTKKSDMPYKRFKKLGFQETYLYNDEQKRVIMTLMQSLSNTNNERGNQ